MSVSRIIFLTAIFLVPGIALSAAPPPPGQPGGPPAGPSSPFAAGPSSPFAAGPPALPEPAPLPPPLPLQVTAQFFYDDGGKPAGPFSIADLRAKVAAGTITPSTLMWKAGTPNWVAAKDAPEVAALFGAASPVGVPPVAAVQLDPNTYLLGTWQSEDAGPPGSIGLSRLTLTLGRGGSVSGTYAYTPAAGVTRMSLPVTGFWSAEAAGARRASLALSLLIQNGPQVQTLSTNSTLDLVDNNTLRDVSDGSLTTRVP